MQRYLRIGFGPIPCSCEGLTCGCCSGINIQYYDFNQKACMNFTYDPYEFSLLINMLMNENSLFTQSFSGKNPPPACIPFSMPLLPQVNFCLKFFNLHTPGYNLFMCIDFETRIQSTPILVLHFDCMQMGVDGIQYHKPEDAEIPPIEESQEGAEIYDEVFEEGENKTSTAKPKTSVSPEKDAENPYEDEIC
ncbi:UNVERIFIED_CONTAM: hypothetical protein PYX00_001092 [Menopon gallinae]|uniref:DUF4773 domain-containing protein n=1 Tax=Menopon gallinae TaxID=328185 RepID=A0AAW2ICV4_9NEOP